MKLFSLKVTAKKPLDLFRVDEAQMKTILAEVRSQLPTTEALLIGKPQAEKSSIVRGLTGVGKEIVGQGFRSKLLPKISNESIHRSPVYWLIRKPLQRRS